MDRDAVKLAAFEFVEAFVPFDQRAAVLYWSVGLAEWLVGRRLLDDPEAAPDGA